MQDTQLLNDGLALMGLGMGFVFVFLTVLVLAVILMSTLVRRFSPEPAAAPASPSVTSDASSDDETMVVISAAIHRYRSRHQR